MGDLVTWPSQADLTRLKGVGIWVFNLGARPN